MQRILSVVTGQVYHYGLKPLMFRQDPEVVHNRMVAMGKKITSWAPVAALMKALWAYQTPQTLKKIDGIVFPNPVGLAAGFDYDGDLLTSTPAIGFGFHTIGTVTLRPYSGNPAPRLTRLPDSQSIIVNKGLKSSGAAAIIAKLSQQVMHIPTGISIASTNRKYESESEQILEITDCFRLFEESSLKHSYYELNISCPNTFGGEPFTTPKRLEKLMNRMDALKLSRPLYVKMPIDQDNADTLQLLKVLDRHSVQGVVFGNLTKDKTNPDVKPADVATWKSLPGNLSGRPTFKRSNQRIKLCRAAFGSRFTIIGTGGIFSGAEAAEKMRLGADLVQLITGMIYEGPQLIGQINQYLATRKLE